MKNEAKIKYPTPGKKTKRKAKPAAKSPQVDESLNVYLRGYNLEIIG